MECWITGAMNYETKLRNKNRGYMKLIVWQRAMVDWINRISEDPEEYASTPSFQRSITPTHRSYA
jgi:hypothetical protein